MRVMAVHVLVSVCFLGLLALSWKLLNWVWLRPKKLEKKLREQGFTGNPYRLLLGDLKDISRMVRLAKSEPISFSQDIASRLVPFDHHTINTYGKKSFMWVGPIPRVFITEAEQVKNVFAKINHFQKPVSPIIKYLGVGLPILEGEQWAKHRKIISPVFQMEKLKKMLSAFDQSCSEMVGSWESLVPEGGSHEVDVWPYLQDMTGDVISRSAFGSNFEEGRMIFQVQRELADIVTQAAMKLNFPGSRFLPTKTNRRAKEIEKIIETTLTGIIQRRMKAMEAGEPSNDDLLDILLETNRKEIQEHGNDKVAGMSLKDVLEECKLFYFAGQETTSVLLVWTLILISKHQDWQERARKEVLDAFGYNKPHFEGLARLKVISLSHCITFSYVQDTPTKGKMPLFFHQNYRSNS